MKIGSLKSPGATGLLKAGLFVVPLAFVLVLITFELGWLALLPLAVGALTALFIHARGGADRSPSGEAPALHAGYNVSRVAIGGGFPGAVLVIGFVWIFLSGLPGVYLFVLPMAAAGVCVGVLLTLRNRPRPPASSSSLGLSERWHPAPPDEPSKGQ